MPKAERSRLLIEGLNLPYARRKHSDDEIEF